MKTLRTTLIRPKDPLEPGEKSKIINGLECSQCPVEYIGETGGPVFGSTKGPSTDTKLPLKCEDTSVFGFDNAKVISRDQSKGGRL